MTQQQDRHALFQQLQQDHDELRRLLGEVHHVLAAKLENVARVAEMVESLTDHVETHFDEEEATGVFDEVIAREPRLSPRADELRAEHARLKKTVQALNQAAKSGDGASDWWEKLEKSFHDFSKDLMRHEHQENELVQVAYEQDLGAGD